jgi:transcription initiation factor TFIIB
VTTGVHPAGFAAACIYKAGCEHGRRLIKTEVAGAANVSASTLRTHRDTLDELVA